MSEKRRGLGKGLGALIPTAPAEGRPVDVFFPTQRTDERTTRAEREGAADAAPDAAPAARRNTAKRSTTPTEAASDKAASTSRPRSGSKRTKIPADTLPARQQAKNGGSGGTKPAAKTVKATDSALASDSAPVAAGPAPDDGQALVAVPGARFVEIPVDTVVANRRQPRQVFDEEDLEELAASIREVGVLQPIVVRELVEAGEFQYELIMGERRWRASQLAGNTTVPAIVREVDDTDLLRDALLENLHRAQLNPLEEAAAYQQLLDDFSCTHEELAARIARSRPQISNTLRLLKLPPLVQRRLAAGVLSAGHARALLGLSDPAAMERLAQRIVAEGLSVRTTEEIVALGDEPIAPEMRRRPRTGPHAADLEQLATKLADRFDTRVKIGMGQRKGKINIEFASLEDLNRILELLAPNVDGVAQE